MTKKSPEQVNEFSNEFPEKLTEGEVLDAFTENDSSEIKNKLVRVSVGEYSIAVPKGYKILYCVNDTVNRPVLRVNSTPTQYFVVAHKSSPYCGESFHATNAPASLVHTMWVDNFSKRVAFNVEEIVEREQWIISLADKGNVLHVSVFLEKL